jgi:uncharacterized protein (DUF1697 family)
MTGTTYVALLKGINVGGHHSVQMPELRELLSGLGYERPETYIQSGNAIFEIDDSALGPEPDAHEQRIAEALEARFEFRVPVMIRTVDDLSGVLTRVPFDVEADPKLVHVLFLGSEPTDTEWSKVDVARAAGDPVVWSGREVFVHYRHGSGRSKFTGDYVERTLRTGVTARNLNTIAELYRRAVARQP